MEIKILGKTYAIKSSHDARFTQEAAEMVEGKVRELAKKMGPLAAERIAVLTAMNLAGELLQLQRTLSQQKNIIHDRIDGLIEKIDSELLGG